MLSNRKQEVTIADIKILCMSILVKFAILSSTVLIFMLLGAVLGVSFHGFGW